MKHFILSLFAVCSILLMAAFTVQKVPESNKQKSYSYNITVKNSLETTQHVNFQLIDNLFSKGNLPERISVPAPAVKSVNDKSVKNESDRKKENRKLNGLDDPEDFYPDQPI